MRDSGVDKREYFQDLVRSHMNEGLRPDDHLNEIWKRLFPGLTADESEFRPVSLKDIQKRRGRQKAGLII